MKMSVWLGDTSIFIFPLEAHASHKIEIALPPAQNNYGHPSILIAHVSVLFVYLNVAEFCIFDPYNGKLMWFYTLLCYHQF